jgi:dTMP kinase
MYYQFIVPDVTFYLDISLAEADKRLSKSKKHAEIYDNREMNRKVKKGYEWLIKKFPDKFTILDGNKSIEEISKSISGHLAKITT